jgi:hypothetical protein
MYDTSSDPKSSRYRSYHRDCAGRDAQEQRHDPPAVVEAPTGESTEKLVRGDDDIPAYAGPVGVVVRRCIH